MLPLVMNLVKPIEEFLTKANTSPLWFMTDTPETFVDIMTDGLRDSLYKVDGRSWTADRIKPGGQSGTLDPRSMTGTFYREDDNGDLVPVDAADAGQGTFFGAYNNTPINIAQMPNSKDVFDYITRKIKEGAKGFTSEEVLAKAPKNGGIATEKNPDGVTLAHINTFMTTPRTEWKDWGPRNEMAPGTIKMLNAQTPHFKLVHTTDFNMAKNFTMKAGPATDTDTEEPTEEFAEVDRYGNPKNEYTIGFTMGDEAVGRTGCLLYTSPSPRDGLLSRMPSSA